MIEEMNECPNPTLLCECCGVVFHASRTNAEALSEAQTEWGDIPEKERAVICHDCYLEVMAFYGKFPTQ